MASVDLAWVHGWASGPAVWQPSIDRLGGASHRQLGWEANGTTLALTGGLVPGTVLVGWSLGGMLALERAAAGGVKALVVLAGVPCFVGEGGWAPAVLRRMERRLDLAPADVLDTFTAMLFTPAEREGGAEASYRQAVQGAADPTTLAAGLRYLREADLTAQALALDIPALWLHGMQDAVCPFAAHEAWRRQVAARPHHRFVSLPKAGHALPWTHPASIAHHLQAFLDAI